jgi:hypothetical protein
MKRIVLLSVAAIFAVIGSACERHPATKLPEHYQHGLHADAGDHAKDPHAKAPASAEAPKH